MDPRKSLPLKDELNVGPLEFDDIESLAIGCFISKRTENTSLSNWSASSEDNSEAFFSRSSDLERSESVVSDVHSCDCISTRSDSCWRYGISMLERTSWSSNPSISISCILEREMNLTVDKVNKGGEKALR